MQLKLPLIGVVLLALGTPAIAGAQESPMLDRSAVRAHGAEAQDLHFSGGFGWSQDTTLQNAVAHSLSVGYRWRFFDAGLVGDFGTRGFGGSYAMTGVTLGATLQTDSGERFTLGGVLGSDAYVNVGCDLFCQNGGGASAPLPYAGLRASASHVFPSRSSVHLELGVSGFWGRDLETQSVSITPTDSLLAPSEPETRTLGGQRIGAIATVGLTWDTGPRPAASSVARR
jgi:hypothetical protein